MKGRTLTRKPKREGRGRYVARRRVCAFCASKVDSIDYKDAAPLRRYISDRGKIEPRRRTGTCARHQRVLATALKRARTIGILPFAPVHVRRIGGVGTGSFAPRPQQTTQVAAQPPAQAAQAAT